MRFAAKIDTAQPDIVDALEDAGYKVLHLKRPCDLGVLIPATAGIVQLMECKTATKSGKIRKRKDQREQEEFLIQTGTPIVSTPEQALTLMRQAMRSNVNAAEEA